MKKKIAIRYLPLRNDIILIVMRTFIFLFCSTIFAFSPIDVVSQNSKVKIEKEQLLSVDEVFDLIMKQTNYKFFYEEGIFKNFPEVKVEKGVITTNKLLNSILTQGNLEITITKNNAFIIKEKPVIIVKQQQEKKITGIISDKNGLVLPGVNIVEKGTKNGTQTDLDGKFSLILTNEKAVLVTSYVGFQSKEEVVGSRSVVNIILQEDTENLHEVVVVGYGKQKRASITGAVTSIDSEKLTIAPVANVSQSLAGRLPGLITKQESGLPGGDAASLSIRGFGSPLVIVDGIEANINNLSSDEIETMTVLKDASAAVYGARAGNGVILVTTKRGNKGKPDITFSSSTTFQSPVDLVKMASSGQMAELNREEHTNNGRPESTQRFTQEQVDLYYAGTNSDYPNTDWYSVVARDNAPMTQYNLSVRGGSEKFKYYGSLGYLDQETIFKNNGGEYKRYNLRSNVDAQITDNLSMQIDISNIWEDRDMPWRIFNGSNNTIWQEYWNTEPFFSPTNPDGSLSYGGAGGAIGINALSNKDHGGYQRDQSQNMTSSLALNYDFSSLVKGLKARSFVNINQANSYNKSWRYLPSSYTYNYSNDTYTQNTFQTAPDLKYTDSRSRNLTGQFSLNYSNTFAEDHEVSALALFEVIDYQSEWISAGRGAYTSTAIEYLFNGGIGSQTSDGRAAEMGRQSFVFRGNYAYKSKYLLEATMRIDESAKFAKENRKGSFPSVSLGWRVSKEDFLKDSKVINDLKLRLSYSETGQDNVGDFKYLSGYQSGDLYFIGSSPSNGLVSTGLANPLLTWETMKVYNAGIDFSLLKRSRQLFGEFDVFWRDREGIPGNRTVSLPDTFGATLPLENLNAINTRGFELTIGHEGNIKDFKYKISGNVSYSRSKWSSFDEPEYADADMARQQTKTGQWTDRSFGYVSEGLFTSQTEIDALDYVYDSTLGNVNIKPGDIRYKDINNDGLLDWKDQVQIGNGNTPNWIGGFNFDLAYKGFDLSGLFQGGFGFTQRLNLRYGQNYSELMYDNRWTPENNNKDGLIPRLGGANSNSWGSDFYDRNSSYVRLKTLSIGYSIPISLMKKINVQKLRIYFAGTNLFTFSKIGKYQVDPESPSGLGGYYYPQMRNVSFGLNLSL